MKHQNSKIPLVPLEMLSTQQKQIYELYCQGLSNKEIAAKLNLEQKPVATQLTRIRKKAVNLPFTYKFDHGAEHAQYSEQQVSPSDELKKRIQDDPGFFKLMFNRYAVNGTYPNENRYQLASAGQDSGLLFTARAKHVKTMAITGKGLCNGKVVVKMEKTSRQVLGDYLQIQKIQPVQTFWDDGSAIYLVTPRDIKKMQQLLMHRSEL